MILNINLSPAAEANLQMKATAAGVDVATYAARQLELMADPSPELSDLSGPIAEAFSKSGMTEDQLSEFLEREKHAMRRERQGK